MAQVEETVLESLSEDDLIEIHSGSTNQTYHVLNTLLHQPLRARPASPRLPPGRRRGRPPPLTTMLQQSRQPQPPRTSTVIDLTEEPDSPVEVRQSQPPSQAGRNPRRTNSQRITPPSLSRSDSTFMGPGASVIDLTEDSPQDERVSEPRTTRSHRHVFHHHHHHHHRPRNLGQDQLIELEFMNANNGSLYSNIATNVRRMAHIFGMSRGFNATPIDYPPSFAPREPSPKPPMEPAPATRDGFTRDTTSTDEQVVICPACSDELAYDPTGTAPAASSSPAGGRKRKRAPGEHHFWALKKCGHVYCADCFENRRPTKGSPQGVGFRGPLGKAPISAPNDIRCAVDNCDTKVALKSEWVGIYL